ncbi:RNA 2',3'-cyclic phosphodiesterase [soil metagenome]
MRAKRLFVSLDLPETIAAALVRLDPALPGVRWLGAAQMHLTLAFFGQVGAEAEERLREQLLAIKFGSFFLPLHGIGAFPGRGHPRILWLGVGRGHPHLFQLHKRVTDAALAAGLEPDLRSWHPHITLARCQHVSRAALQPFLRGQAEFDGGFCPVESFHLKSSEPRLGGSFYTDELTVRA